MDRSRSAFSEGLRKNFGFEPTASQAVAMDRLADFIYGKGENFLFQLSGYAGTGKTSLVSALVKTLVGIGVHIVMLAPTGRAAKVLSQYSGRKAYTIHKWIYRVYSKEGVRKFVRRENKDAHTSRPYMDTCLTALQLMVYYRYLPTTTVKAGADEVGENVAGAKTMDKSNDVKVSVDI